MLDEATECCESTECDLIDQSEDAAGLKILARIMARAIAGACLKPGIEENANASRVKPNDKENQNEFAKVQ